MNRKAAFMLVPAAGLVLLAAGLAREGEGNGKNGNSQGEKYVAELQPLNDSGVTGKVYLEFQGDELKVTADLKGLEPDQPHPIHIHGFRDQEDRASSCPPAEEGNGAISMEELVTHAGPPLVEIRLSEEVGAEGELKIEETFRVDPGVLEPLDMRLVAIHGAMVEGTYDPSVPAACGRFEAKDKDMEDDGERMEQDENDVDHEGMEEHEGHEGMDGQGY